MALLVIGFGAWWIAGRAVRPVQRIIATAENITVKGLGERVEGITSNDELGRLAGVLNQMMDRLEESFSQIKRFSADASHELKTPLAVMQGKIEAALQDQNQSSESNLVLVDLLERVGRLDQLLRVFLCFLDQMQEGLLLSLTKLM